MTIARSLLVWLVLFAAGFSNGVFREVVLRRFLDEVPSRQLSGIVGMALMVVVILIAARRWPFRSAGQAAAFGLLWLSMTVAWEFLFFHYVMGHSWEHLLSAYSFSDGNLWPLVLASIAIAPLFARRQPLHSGRET